MTRRAIPSIVALVLAVALASTAGFASARVTRRAADTVFPHVKHLKLFPTCGGCHAGISARDSAAMFPPEASCAECHNGKDVKTVAWAARRRPPTNVLFDHGVHKRAADSAKTAFDCVQCHGEGATPQRMLVTRPRPETCIGCHAHTAPSHLAASSNCATCHVPLARALALSDSFVRALPTPPSHAPKDFIATHGSLAEKSIASCATCHARESCARCHVNADRSQPILALAPDARVARLVAGRPAIYWAPANHRKADFGSAHAGLARTDVRTCATCHTQQSCRACHTGALGASAIALLPPAEPGHAPGVQLLAPGATPLPPWSAAGFTTAQMGAAVRAGVVMPPPRIVRAHPLDIVRTHGPIASSGRLDCVGCHVKQSFCTSCHQGTGERRYHPNNFVSLHPAEAYTREPNCVSCHNTEVFCRSCHREVAGIAAGSRRRSGAAHAAQPVWLLQHGAAARQGMPSCVTCHQQTDCMQCHSDIGSRINPHGSSFDAERMRKKNPTLCSYCHLVIPRG